MEYLEEITEKSYKEYKKQKRIDNCINRYGPLIFSSPVFCYLFIKSAYELIANKETREMMYGLFECISKSMF